MRWGRQSTFKPAHADIITYMSPRNSSPPIIKDIKAYARPERQSTHTTLHVCYEQPESVKQQTGWNMSPIERRLPRTTYNTGSTLRSMWEEWIKCKHSVQGENNSAAKWNSTPSNPASRWTSSLGRSPERWMAVLTFSLEKGPKAGVLHWQWPKECSTKVDLFLLYASNRHARRSKQRRCCQKALPLKDLKLHNHQAASTHSQVIHNPTDQRQFLLLHQLQVSTTTTRSSSYPFPLCILLTYITLLSSPNPRSTHHDSDPNNPPHPHLPLQTTFHCSLSVL